MGAGGVFAIFIILSKHAAAAAGGRLDAELFTGRFVFHLEPLFLLGKFLDFSPVVVQPS